MSAAEPPDGPLDPPRTPESPATDAGSPESEAPAPFLPAESTPPAPSPRRPHRGGAWPIWAAGALVAATLLAVFSLLHPRHAATPSGEEGVPATVTAEELVLQREPSARSAAIATLPQGQRVRVRAETPPWLEVATDAGSGFLPASGVERDADRDARQRRAKTLLALAPVYGVVAEDAEVRARAVSAFRARRHPATGHGDRDPLRGPFVLRVRGQEVGHRVRGLLAHRPRSARSPRAGDRAREDAAAEGPDGGRPFRGAAAGRGASRRRRGGSPAAFRARARRARRAGARAPRSGGGDDAGDPPYPEAARRAGIEGTVELEVAIDASGKVTDVEVVRGLPLGLSESAAESVRRWTWRPARTASGPVASRKTVRIRFLLHPEEER